MGRVFAASITWRNFKPPSRVWNGFRLEFWNCRCSRGHSLEPLGRFYSPRPQIHMTFHHSFPCLAVFMITACSPGPGSAIPETRSEKQMLGLIEKFDRWDYNGDGELSFREINTGVVGLEGSSRAVNYNAADVVKYYDQNGDKTVSLREAQAGYYRTTQEDAAALPH